MGLKLSDLDAIEELEKAGHTYLCATKIVCEDGRCVCKTAVASDEYSSLIRSRDAATAAQILADLCRNKDREISQLRSAEYGIRSVSEEERLA